MGDIETAGVTNPQKMVKRTLSETSNPWFLKVGVAQGTRDTLCGERPASPGLSLVYAWTILPSSIPPPPLTLLVGSGGV